MKNFKEIAEKCLAGELSGAFINRHGDVIPSDMLHKYDSIKYPYMYWENCITRNGDYFFNEEKISDYDIIDFIPNNTQEQIKIDIPEGKVPVMEQTENGVVITWKEKEVTYDGIINEIAGSPKHIIGFSYGAINDTTSSSPFYRKVEALRKLTNIRNYFGLDPHRVSDWVICISTDGTYYARATRQPLCYEIAFSKQEHAEQAIKMLGDELKYLFEPW